MGCGMQEPQWRTYEEVVAKPAPHQHTTPSTPMARPAAAQPAGKLAWTAPDGWKEEAGSGMRLATFTAEREGQSAICTIITLGGTAGGVEANVRRWIGQLALPEPSPEELADYLDRQERLKTAGGFEGVVVDLTALGDQGPEASSMLAALITVGDSTLFLKMTGPVRLLQEEKKSFSALCQSIRTTP
jgi:hypothetical protein